MRWRAVIGEKKERRSDVGGKETGEERGGHVDEEEHEKPTEGMETPSKARRRKEDNSNMGGKGREAWIPVFEMGAARAMDFVALANLAVTSCEMKRVCKDEILMRKECETGHVENPSMWRTRVEQAHQRIKYPYMPKANMDRFAAEHGTTTYAGLI